MATLTKTNIKSNQRLDLPDIRNIENFTAEDFNALTKFLLTGSSYIVSGFRPFQDVDLLVDNPTTSPIYIEIAGSSVLHSEAQGVPFYYVGSEKLKAEKIDLTADAENFIELDLTVTTSAPDTRAFWDPQANAQEGAEFSQIVDTARDLTASITVNQTGFSGGSKLPLMKITTIGSTIDKIEDARNLFFRLGRGNLYDATNEYPWDQGREEPDRDRTEDDDAFNGADKGIKTFKEWMDAIMTEIAKIKGSAYWFADGSTEYASLSLPEVFFDALSSVITGNGKFEHDPLNPGTLNWDSDIYVRGVIGDIFWEILSASTTLQNKQVAYLSLDRGEIIPQDFTFTNGQNLVQAPAGAFTNVSVGDWIKPQTQNGAVWRRVTALSPSNPAFATEATLDDNFSGDTTTEKCMRATATYTVNVADPKDVPASGDTYWLAKRDDNGSGIGGAAVPHITEITTVADVSESLQNTYFEMYSAVDVEAFYVWINVAGNGTDPLVENRTGIEVQVLENASADDVATAVAAAIDADSNFIASAVGSVVTVTNNIVGATSGIEEGQVPTGFSFNNTQVGESAIIYLKGLAEIEQGESREINDNTSEEVQSYVGMKNESDKTPDYTHALGFHSENFHLIDGENLTRGIKRLEIRNDTIPEVTVVDLWRTALPDTAPVVIDTVTLEDGDTVLFTRLGAEGVYRLSISGGSPTWTALPVFGGSVTPENGALVDIIEGRLGFTTIWRKTDTGGWGPMHLRELGTEATGFCTCETSQISFDDASRTFTIAPVGDFFDYFIRGIAFRKPEPQTLQIPDISGWYYIYFNGENLTQTTIMTNTILRDDVYVATVLWDDVNKKHLWVGQQRHAPIMDGDTKFYLNGTVGLKVEEGLELDNFVIGGNGTSDAHSRVGLQIGKVDNEDIIIDIVHSDTPSVDHEQILHPVAAIPVIYRTLSGDWRKDVATDFPVKQGAGGGFEISKVTLPSEFALSRGDYFLLNSANDATEYYIWYENGLAATNEIQGISFDQEPEEGFFKLSFKGEETGNIPFNANAAFVELALKALTTVNDLTVTGDFVSGFIIEFIGLDGLTPQPPILITENTLTFGGRVNQNEIQEITFSNLPSSGSFQLQFEGQITTAINWDEGAAEVEAALEGLAAINSVDVTGDFATGFTVEFTGIDGNQDKTPIEPFASSLSGGLVVGVNEIQRLSFDAVPISGFFVLNHAGNDSTNIPFNATNTDIENILQASIPSINDVSVTGDFASDFVIEFVGLDAETPQPQITVSNNQLVTSVTPGIDEVQRIEFDNVPTQGQFVLEHATNTTAPINFDATAIDIQTELNALASLSTVVVTGDFATGFTITFQGADGQQDQPQISFDSTTLEYEQIPALDEIQMITFSNVPTQGSWRFRYNGVSIADTNVVMFNTPAATLQTLFRAIAPADTDTATITGDYASGFMIEWQPPYDSTPWPLVENVTTFPTDDSLEYPSTPAENEIQQITFSAVPDKGTFRLAMVGNPSVDINWDDNAATVESKIEGITGITEVTVTGDFASGFTIEFTGADAAKPFDQFTVDNNALQTNTVLGVDEVQRVSFSGVPNTGDFTLTFGADTTSTLQFNDNAATIEAALEALPSIGSGNISVSGDFTNDFVFTFQGALAEQPIADQITVTNNNLLIGATLGQNEIQQFSFVNGYIPGSGSVSYSNADGTTSTIDNIDLSGSGELVIEAAFEAVDPSYVGNVSVTTLPGSDFLVEFVNGLAETNIDQFVVATDTLTSNTANPPTTVQAGSPTTGGTTPTVTESTDTEGSVETFNPVTITPATLNDGVVEILSPVTINIFEVQNGQIPVFAPVVEAVTTTTPGTDPVDNFAVISATTDVEGQLPSGASTVVETSLVQEGSFFVPATSVFVDQVTVTQGQGNEPVLPGKTGIQVNISTGESGNIVAQSTSAAILAAAAADFGITRQNNELTITNVNGGITTDAAQGNNQFITVETLSQGTDASNARICWNKNDGGVWSTVDATTDGKYIVMWLFATMGIQEPINAILGQNEWDSLEEALANDRLEDLDTEGLDLREMKALHKLVFKTDSAYTNSTRATLVSHEDLRLRQEELPTHGQLAGLGLPDHPPTAVTTEGVTLDGFFTTEADVKEVIQTLNDALGRTRLETVASDRKKVKITPAQIMINDGEGGMAAATIRRYLMAFPGVLIDFETGQIRNLEDTVTLQTFTPETIGTGRFLWYGVSLKNTSVDSNGQMRVSVEINAASSDGVSPDFAEKPRLPSGNGVGWVVVQEEGGSITDIFEEDLIKLSAGAGGGGGDIAVFKDFQEVKAETTTLNFQGNGVVVEEGDGDSVNVIIDGGAIRKNTEGNVIVDTSPVEGAKVLVLRDTNNTLWESRVSDEGVITMFAPSLRQETTPPLLLNRDDDTVVQLTVTTTGVLVVNEPAPDALTGEVDNSFFMISPTGFYWKFRVNNDNEIVTDNVDNHFEYTNDIGDPMWRIQQTDKDRGIMYNSTYRFADLEGFTPTPFPNTAAMCYYDDELGSIRPIYYDGTNWRFFSDNSILL